MDCRDVREEMDLALDDDAPLSAAATAHRQACPACARAWTARRRLVAELRAGAPAPAAPAGLAGRTMARVRAAAPERSAPKAASRSRRRWILAAAALLLLAVGAGILQQRAAARRRAELRARARELLAIQRSLAAVWEEPAPPARNGQRAAPAGLTQALSRPLEEELGRLGRDARAAGAHLWRSLPWSAAPAPRPERAVPEACRPGGRAVLAGGQLCPTSSARARASLTA
jgi:hypothetical protein